MGEEEEDSDLSRQVQDAAHGDLGFGAAIQYNTIRYDTIRWCG